jgi:hypothetical protein
MLAVAELASAWGTLAPRLPPNSSVVSANGGVETAMLIEALKLALSSLQVRTPPAPSTHHRRPAPVSTLT